MSYTADEVLESAQVSDDPVVVAVCLAEALDHRDSWRSVVANIEEHLALVMEGHGKKHIEVPGIGTVDLSKRTKRSGWDWDALLSDLLKATPEHCEVSRTTGEAEAEVATLLRLVRECIGFSSGKVGGIRKFLPHDVDEYCAEVESAPAVSLRRYDK